MTGRPAPSRLRVGVVPAGRHAERARLLAALEAVHPVRFEARDTGALRDLDAVVAVGPAAAAAVAHADVGVPVLLALGDEPGAETAEEVALADTTALAAPLRGARLHDATARCAAVPVGGGDAVLATAGGRPAWTRRGRLDVVAAFPAELEPAEALRERLAPGRSLALLGLTAFLRDLCAGHGWEPPTPRAAFVIDDPNLRWPSYGHIDYGELSAHASAHGYHVAIAMVPLDARPVHPRAAGVFRAGARHLSICVHGNDHKGPELGRPRSEAEGVALAGQALRRVAAFERHAHVHVSRVMVPPHERVSEPAARALLACGYEAICTTRPYPWVATGPDMHWLARPADAGPLAGWEPIDRVAGGLAVLLRAGFAHPREDLVLRAFLGQALILYGHQEDLGEGLDVLADAAADINRLGDVNWGSLSDLARSATLSRRDGATLFLRPLAHRVRAAVPAGVEQVCVDAGALGARALRAALDGGPLCPVEPMRPIAVSGAGWLDVVAGGQQAVPVAAHTRGRRLWALGRRAAGEARDRLRGRLAAGAMSGGAAM